MIIKNMFSKPIDRDIKGVIKVGQDDDANIKQELEEYVVTRELQKHFSDFDSETVFLKGKNEWRKKENRTKQFDIFLRLKGVQY